MPAKAGGSVRRFFAEPPAVSAPLQPAFPGNVAFPIPPAGLIRPSGSGIPGLRFLSRASMPVGRFPNGVLAACATSDRFPGLEIRSSDFSRAVFRTNVSIAPASFRLYFRAPFLYRSAFRSAVSAARGAACAGDVRIESLPSGELFTRRSLRFGRLARFCCN